MIALVTGGAGFVGSNIVNLLINKKYYVRVIDNLSSGSISNIQKFINNREIDFIEGDIKDFDFVNECMKDVDVVFHLAALVGRQRSIDSPQLDSETNLIGTINILEAMRNNNVTKIIYSSSAAIFGELHMPTIDENHPQNADTPYGVSKLAAEKMILAYHNLYPQINAVCLRYFNIYGINQRYDVYGNVIPIFAKRIFSNEPLVIYGDGKQTRDFVNVNDIARANYLASLYNATDVFNVGSGNSISINDLANMMGEIAKKKVNIIHASERVGDVKHCKANTNKIYDTLGFKTEVDLYKGLSLYMNWYKENVK